VAFASGLFLTLPLYFKTVGGTEVLFGQVYAAGAIGTLAVVSMSVVLLRRLGLQRVAPLGSLLFAAGSLLYVLAVQFHTPLWTYFIASLIQGAGWGLVFTMGPICMSTTVDDSNRSYLFTIYAAYSTLGVGLAPILGRLATTYLNWQYRELFLSGAICSALAWVVSSSVARSTPAYASVKGGATLSGMREFIDILKLPSVNFFGMVFFGACVYTAMINLQTTFAAAQNIDYTVFYGFYSLAVVLARFFLSKPIGKLAPAVAIKGLMLLMLVALALFFYAHTSLAAYAVGALLLGISYGLVYPIVQAQATQYAPAHLRPQTLVYFSLSYFIAVYLFPYAGAEIAVQYGYASLIGVLLAAAGIELLLALVFYSAEKRNRVTLTSK